MDYIDNIAKISSNKTLSETEKLEIYRTLNSYQVKLTEMFRNLCCALIKKKQSTDVNYDDVIIEFDIDKNFLSSVKLNYEEQKNYLKLLKK